MTKQNGPLSYLASSYLVSQPRSGTAHFEGWSWNTIKHVDMIIKQRSYMSCNYDVGLSCEPKIIPAEGRIIQWRSATSFFLWGAGRGGYSLLMNSRGLQPWATCVRILLLCLGLCFWVRKCFRDVSTPVSCAVYMFQARLYSVQIRGAVPQSLPEILEEPNNYVIY